MCMNTVMFMSNNIMHNPVGCGVDVVKCFSSLCLLPDVSRVLCNFPQWFSASANIKTKYGGPTSVPSVMLLLDTPVSLLLLLPYIVIQGGQQGPAAVYSPVRICYSHHTCSAVSAMGYQGA